MTDSSQELMMQADALLNAGKLQEAQNIYLSISQQPEGAAPALFKLAWIADKEGKPLSAKKYLQKAYDKEPNNKEFLTALSTVLSKNGRNPEAISLYENFLARNPKEDDIYFQLGILQANSQQFPQALKSLNQCINLNPGRLPYYMKLGELLFHLGQFAESLSIYKRAYDKGLQSEGLFMNLAKLSIDFGEVQQAKDVLSRGMIFFPRKLSFPYRLQSIDKHALKPAFYQGLLDNAGQVKTEELFYYYWLLAQHEQLNEAPQAEMAYLIKAHEAFKQNASFKVSADAFLKMMQQLHQNAQAASAASFSAVSDSATPIFIVGVPRCGSTLLETIISSGPSKVAKGEETGIIFHYASTTLNPVNADNWNIFKERCQQHYTQLGLHHSEHGFTDKSLENLLFIDLILALYPKAKIIYCQRNPLACAVSILRNNLSVLPWAHDIESILAYLDLNLKAIATAKAKYTDQILTLDYETLVTDPVSTSKELMEFCELPWDEACLSAQQRQKTFSKTASHQQIRQDIHTNSISLYQQYAAIFSPYAAQYPWIKGE